MTQRQAPPKPTPVPEHPAHTKEYWEGTKRGELMCTRCKSCGRWFWYPRERCPFCMSDRIEWAKTGGKGRLHAFGTIYQPAHPAFRAETPYTYCAIDLDEGVRIASNVLGLTNEQMHDPLIIDMPVEVVFEERRTDRDDEEWVIPQFRPTVDPEEFRNQARAAWEAAGRTPPPIGPIIGIDRSAGGRGLTRQT